MGKAVFVTGGVRNTGLAIARRFAREGWDVAISSRDGTAAVETAEREQRAFPRTQWMGVGMDPADVESIRGAFGMIRQRFGCLRAFVSNAANLGVGMSVLNADVVDWDAVMNVNARGSFFGAQEAARLMKDGGAILFISSVHAREAIPGRILYSTSKAALGGMMRSMAVELGCLGIRVNTILAGAIRTDRWNGLTEQEIDERRGRYPAGRESAPSRSSIIAR